MTSTDVPAAGRRLTTRHTVLATTVAAAVLAAVAQAPNVAAVPPSRTLAQHDYSAYTTARANIADSFDRRVGAGLGGAPRGGRYTVTPKQKFSVKSGSARLAPLRRGTAARATLSSLNAVNEIVQATFSLNRRPSRGAVWLSVETRRQPNNSSYRSRVKVAPRGRLTVDIVRVTRGAEKLISTQVVLGSRLRNGQQLNVQSYATGANSTAVTLKARAWVRGASVPAWQVQTVQRGVDRISRGGSVGISVYASRTQNSPVVKLEGFYGWALRQLRRTLPVPPTPPTKPVPTKPAPTKPAPTKPAPPTPTTEPTTPAPTSSEPTTPAPTTDAPTTPAPTTPAPTTDAPTTPAPTTDAPTTPAPTPTTTSPTTTPPAPPTSGGTTYPGATNTGVPAAVALKPYYGDLRITTPGAVYDGLDIHGFVYVRAANVTIRNSIVRGGKATGNLGLVNVDNRSTGFTITDSELVPEFPSVWLDGIKGWNYSAVRVNIHGTVDGAKAYGDNVLIKDSWIHGTVSYASDPNQNGGPTHNDGIQVLSGGNLVFIGNNIEGGGNAALQVTQGNGVVKDMRFSNNLVGGGACSVNIATKPLNNMSNVVLNGNRFQRNSTYNCAMIIDKTVVWTGGDNMFVNDSRQANVVARG